MHMMLSERPCIIPLIHFTTPRTSLARTYNQTISPGGGNHTSKRCRQSHISRQTRATPNKAFVLSIVSHAPESWNSNRSAKWHKWQYTSHSPKTPLFDQTRGTQLLFPPERQPWKYALRLCRHPFEGEVREMSSAAVMWETDREGCRGWCLLDGCWVAFWWLGWLRLFRPQGNWGRQGSLMCSECFVWSQVSGNTL